LPLGLALLSVLVGRTPPLEIAVQMIMVICDGSEPLIAI
jgi:hypothetical protein